MLCDKETRSMGLKLTGIVLFTYLAISDVETCNFGFLNFGLGNYGFLNVGFGNKGFLNTGALNVGAFNLGVRTIGAGNVGTFNTISVANIGGPNLTPPFRRRKRFAKDDSKLNANNNQTERRYQKSDSFYFNSTTQPSA